MSGRSVSPRTALVVAEQFLREVFKDGEVDQRERLPLMRLMQALRVRQDEYDRLVDDVRAETYAVADVGSFDRSRFMEDLRAELCRHHSESEVEAIVVAVAALLPDERESRQS